MGGLKKTEQRTYELAAAAAAYPSPPTRRRLPATTAIRCRQPPPRSPLPSHSHLLEKGLNYEKRRVRKKRVK